MLARPFHASPGIAQSFWLRLRPTFRNPVDHDNIYSFIAPVKTTIDLPDDLLVIAKVCAAQRRTTLRELVVEGLRRVTESPTEAEVQERQREIHRLLEAMQASNSEPMIPLNREEIYDR